jgi:hypothetical protein
MNRLLRIAFFTTVAFIIHYQNATAQEKTCHIKGQLTVKNGTYLPFTIISLYKNADSLRLTATVTDSIGSFVFSGVPPGNYYIGVEVSRNKTRLLPDLYQITKQVDSLRVEIDPGKTLQEVVVTARKPFLQKESDRLVINLENSLLTKGNSLLEAFRKLPGLDVLAGKTITVNGNGDVLIIIDGKSYKSSSDQALQLLSSLRSDNVEKIEIYTTPPARFEAEGSSVINVVLKKDRIFSAINAAYGQRLYPEPGNFGGGRNQFSGGGNFFYSFGKFRVNSRIDISDNSTSFTRSADQAEFTSGKRKTDALLTSDATNLYLSSNINYVNRNHTVTLGLAYNTNLRTRIRSVSNDVFLNQAEQKDSAFQSAITTKVSYSTPLAILGYNYLINKAKSQAITFTAIAGDYHNDYDIEQRITNVAAASTDVFLQDQDYSVKTYAFKIDYTQASKTFGKIDAGFRRTQLSSIDEYIFTNRPASSFDYDESINAVYLSTAKTLKNKMSYTAGVRAEHTSNKGASSLLPGKSVSMDYLDIFPNFSLQYPVSKKSKLGLSYSRRIARPSYNNFNPASYAVFNDAFSSQEGNINLKPQYISKYELSFQRNTYYAALTYSHKTNVRSLIAEEDNNRFITYKTINITGYDVNLLSFYSRKLARWTEASISASGQYYYYRLVNAGQSRGLAIRLSATEAFTVNPTTSFDVSVRYYSPFRMEYWRMGGYYTVDAAARKSLFNNTLTFIFAINDLTGSNKVTWKYMYPDVTRTVNPLTNERLFTFSVSYRFKTANRFQLRRTSSDEFGEMRFYK